MANWNRYTKDLEPIYVNMDAAAWLESPTQKGTRIVFLGGAGLEHIEVDQSLHHVAKDAGYFDLRSARSLASSTARFSEFNGTATTSANHFNAPDPFGEPVGERRARLMAQSEPSELD